MSTLSESQSGRKLQETELQHERWAHWPVNWTAVWVGALATVACLFLFGLIGIAIGANSVDAGDRLVNLKSMSVGTMALGIFGAFVASVVGGWVAAKIAGILRAEPAMLHGAIVWIVAVPILLLLASQGAGQYFGAWNAGLITRAQAAAPYQQPGLSGVGATSQEVSEYRAEQMQYRQDIKQWREDTPRAVRNSALCAITALLLGLMGSVIGGWMGCGEPMTLTHHLTRAPQRATA